jgi:hypothetical protein
MLIAFKSIGLLWLFPDEEACGGEVTAEKRPASYWTVRTKSEYLRGRLSC